MSVGRSQMLSLNRIELLQSLRLRSSQKTHPDKLHIPVSEPQLCLLQSLPDASNFETCHALEATTVMKTHLGCCSIKWIHIGFLLLAIWRSYLTTSLQNVCVCVHATEWFASSGGALKKSLKSPGNSRYPSTCLFLQWWKYHFNKRSTVSLCFSCHIYFNIKTQRKWLQAPSKQLFKVQDPISLVCGLHIPLFPKARAS